MLPRKSGQRVEQMLQQENRVEGEIIQDPQLTQC